MILASFPPWWLAAIALAVVIGALALAYRRPLVPLSRPKLAALVLLRASAVVLLLFVLVRPMTLGRPDTAHAPVVPVLIDASRSMGIADADGLTRVDRAKAIAEFDLLPALARSVRTPVFAVGADAAETPLASIQAASPRSDLLAALSRVRERFRGQRVAGIVLLSDGADTGRLPAAASAARDALTVPVYAIGIGDTTGPRDREVVSIAAGDPRLIDASVDLQVATSSSGFGSAPYDVRLLANGTAVQSKRVSPSADATPVHVTFTVVPGASAPTVYTVEVPAAPNESIVENNAQTIVVNAPGRKRRMLAIAGAPGFEHSFMMRAWSADAGLDVDAVVRKGKNAEGRETFVIQAPAERARALSSGFPARLEDLYAYDALVVEDVEGSFFTRAQLAAIADFVAQRGGGVLVAGNRSLGQGGFAGTPLEPVLPVELDARRGGVARAMLTGDRAEPNHVTPTADGETHPIMRLGVTAAETRAQWAALPALAASTPLGPPRAGASVLAVVAAPDGGVFPVVAVQRYGEGRSMTFGGDASWRWRMLSPSTDRSHELFWRQAARWLAGSSPDPVTMTVRKELEPGDAGAIDVNARDASFSPVPDAQVTASVAADGEPMQPLVVRRGDAAGHFAAAFSPARAGLYRVHVDAARGAVTLGGADETIYVGGASREFADPRLNEGVLRRLARDSGGRYVRAPDASRVLSWLDAATRQPAEPDRRDAWDRPWLLAAVVLLLGVEWTLRRRWGLR